MIAIGVPKYATSVVNLLIAIILHRCARILVAEFHTDTFLGMMFTQANQACVQ